MAIDTRQRRSSVVNMGMPLWRSLPIPDGTLTQADRNHALRAYAGILFAAPPAAFTLGGRLSIVETTDLRALTEITDLRVLTETTRLHNIEVA